MVHAGKAAVATINRWAADETHGRIPEILGEPLPVETRLVLANATYFKGRWTSAFKVPDTKGEAFHAPGETFEVPLMKRWAYVPYAHVDGVQVVELPYRGGPVMLVALPDKADGLADLEAHVAARYASWRQALKATGAENVDLKLPRWRAEWEKELVPPLQEMGMRRAFQDDADLTGMCASGSLVVSDVLQKTFVEVNEEGSEAAAVTVVVTDTISAIEPMEPRVVFHADHPFLYAILDPATEAILFLGRVEDPRTSAPR